MVHKATERRRENRRVSYKPSADRVLRDRARESLHCLYQISKRLTAFESLEKTVPEILTLAKRVVPLESGVLAIKVGGVTATSVWPSAGLTADKRRIAQAYAEASFAYFADLGSPRAPLEATEQDSVHDRDGRSIQAGDAKFIALPLVVDYQCVFGVLCLEGVLDENDLAFVSAVSNQLAVALDRHYAWRADVATRDEAEAAEQRYRTLVDNLDQAFVWEANPETLQVSYISSRVETMLGYSLDQWREPDAWAKYLHPDDRDHVMAIFRAAVSEGTSQQVDHRVQSTEGRSLWLHTGLHVVRVSPKGQLVQGVSVDITPLKEAEEQLRQQLAEREKLLMQADTANQAKDEFLATLSHELRTPLNAILGWTHLLQEGRLDEAKTAAAFEVIRRNAGIQNQLIGDILDIQTIVSGKLRLHLRPVNLVKVVESARDTLKLAADAKDTHIEILHDSDASVAPGDPDRLQQVIWNLLSNAIKFTARGGRVEIRLRRPDHAHVEITVSDNGPGIPPSFLPHVFDRFRQADASTTRRHGGLGLGLAIVRKIVELHGGTVTAANHPEKGAVFTTTLPSEDVLTQKVVKPDVVSPVVVPSLDGVLVLIVDDGPDEREVLTKVLEQNGAEVLTAPSASEGLTILECARPDVLLSDIGMPDEDGYAFLRRVRALPRDRGGLTPAAALTGFATEDDRRKALEAGFETHLPKPLNPSELVTLVATLAGRSRTREA